MAAHCGTLEDAIPQMGSGCLVEFLRPTSTLMRRLGGGPDRQHPFLWERESEVIHQLFTGCGKAIDGPRFPRGWVARMYVGSTHRALRHCRALRQRYNCLIRKVASNLSTFRYRQLSLISGHMSDSVFLTGSIARAGKAPVGGDPYAGLSGDRTAVARPRHTVCQTNAFGHVFISGAKQQFGRRLGGTAPASAASGVSFELLNSDMVFDRASRTGAGWSTGISAIYIRRFRYRAP